MATAPPNAGTEPAFAALRSRKLRLLIPLIVAFAFMMEQLDATIVTTAIPDIARSLGVTALQMSATVTAYVLSLAVFMPVSGWVADRYGARRVFAMALFIFTSASVLCGLSDNLPMLVAMRVLQGFGGAMMTPVGRLVLIRAFPRSQLVTAMTYMAIPAVVGPVVGPLLGGVLTTYANWRWVFYVNVPIGLVGIVLALRFVEDQPLSAPPRFDMVGFLLCGSGLGLVQFGLEDLGHPMLPTAVAAAMTAAGLLLLAVYVPYSRGRRDPALDLGLFALRSFRVSTLAGGLSRIGVNAVPFMLPLLFQIGFGLSPVVSGSLTFVSSVGTWVVRPVSARLLRRFGFRGLLAGNGAGATVHAALAGIVDGAGVRHCPQHTVHDHQHADVRGHAGGAAEPCDQPGRGDPAADDLVWRFDCGGGARRDRGRGQPASCVRFPRSVPAGGADHACIRSGVPAVAAGRRS
jgi:EmrB/QacA subfamily drug resistance transporter